MCGRAWLRCCGGGDRRSAQQRLQVECVVRVFGPPPDFTHRIGDDLAVARVAESNGRCPNLGAGLRFIQRNHPLDISRVGIGASLGFEQRTGVVFLADRTLCADQIVVHVARSTGRYRVLAMDLHMGTSTSWTRTDVQTTTQGRLGY